MRWPSPARWLTRSSSCTAAACGSTVPPPSSMHPPPPSCAISLATASELPIPFIPRRQTMKARRSLMLRTLLASAALLALGQAPAHADLLKDIREAKKIRIALDTGSPPYGFVDDAMKPVGSDVETAQLLAQDLGVAIEVVQTTSPNRIPFLQTAKGAQMVRYDDDATLVTATVSGQADIIATSPAIVNTVLAKAPQKDLAIKFVMQTVPLGIGLRKNEPEHKAWLNDWIKRNTDNGKLGAIYKKYHGG